MTIEFHPIKDPNCEEVFQLIKQGLFPYVDAVFGWDDDFQRQRIADEYQPEWFHWVYEGEAKVGLVCFKPYDQALHLHLIVLAEDHCGQGLGKKTMIAVQRLAAEEQRAVTLSCFQCNHRAVRLYQSLGYEVTEQDEYFVSFALPSMAVV